MMRLIWVLGASGFYPAAMPLMTWLLPSSPRLSDRRRLPGAD